MTIDEIIGNFTNENGFAWGIDTAMKSLRPGCLYALQAGNGQFEIVDWPEGQTYEPPTPQEIRDEYIRHRTIAECLDHFNKYNKTD